MTELSNELGYKVDFVVQQDVKIKRLSEDVQKYEQQIQEKSQIEQ